MKVCASLDVNIRSADGSYLLPSTSFNCINTSKGDILLNGHTHIPAHQDNGTFIYMNPGSVSIPKENSAHGYMIYDGEFHWKKLDGAEIPIPLQKV